MKAKFVKENLNEFDSFEEEIELVDTPFDDVDIKEDDDILVQDDLEVAINNELKVPEYSRRTVSFRVKGEPGIINAIPMARMKDGSFLMKIGDKYRKFKIGDIIEESLKKRRKI
jgi:hypothetical protein